MTNEDARGALLSATPDTTFCAGSKRPNSHPDIGLIALKYEFDTLLVEYAILSKAWPRAVDSAMD